ncbi:acetoacetate--CoA ligase [Chelatococcus composti]|jgi:acetoacetyl-CoA synthetase|uniref:Acetoacetyl-CoA synthetase n=1 Tax=Chelatococcus composti TaxID=1743235 RepID=A0A841K781_9HYPH|nr:acetoacetate--CoA ligase [Chelatococcus composti]MBB6168155.1 acetoacetyl-CoA synthetase [Chelatococcus composti]MBS7736757.1 acetoacetate--CoA ligase [Chelatococcus composti]GGG37858.1 acetoacetyl-coenzyme A synthetase [Chelatococcus composti]
MTHAAPLWTPSPERVAETALRRFMDFLGERVGRRFADYADIHAFSIAEREAFWSALWDFCGVIGEKGERVLVDDRMPGARFFPDARLNFAENLLRCNGASEAMVFRGEDGSSLRLTWADLHALVSRLQQWLAAQGVGVGDRVAAMMPNRPETIAAMLATASLGATWSSCSPDFGVQGVIDRFGQIEPKVFIAIDGYFYAGKRLDLTDKVREVVARLPSLAAVLVVPYIGIADEVAESLGKEATTLPAITAQYAARPVTYERLPFNHPLCILFSSGTTGVPKCIVHGAGGTLLQHLKEHRLQCDLRAGDRFFYFTTCGWMMWNWLASGLATEATLILFDGSPFHPEPSVLFDLAQAERITLFGTSAKYIDACRKAGLAPARTHDLSSVRLITSTGSPLAPESFDYVYEAIKPDVHLASISGGTDIVSCFVGGSPISPVYRGEIQAPGLGMAVEVWDETGKPIRSGKGELVCTRAFPCMPVMFWNDPGGKKYHAAYFERFEGIWCHGDFAEWTEHGGLIIHGRSDATLNPGGVRIGTAEIYAQVERIPEVVEALAIGQEWDNDVRVVLFVRLREGVVLDDALKERIRREVRTGASPRHVPARIVQVADIPRTKSGKITELAVRDVVHGREVKNKEALANPEALDLYRDLPELKE